MIHKVAVLGASGFAGAELLRLLLRHPGMQVVAAAASSQVGKAVADAYPSLDGYGDMRFIEVEEALGAGADIVFSSLPHNQSTRLFGSAGGPKVVDLAGDFRLSNPALFREWFGEPPPDPQVPAKWIYGLTEFHREEISSAGRVANPGCYPAAAILALAPLVASGAIDASRIHIDAKSGVSGAGRAGGEGFDFSSTNENVRAYSVTGHRHIPEIEQELGLLAGSEVTVSFVPHLVPMTRGILATCVAELTGSATAAELIEEMRERYKSDRFVKVLGEDSLPETKRLSGTNFAEVTVRVDRRTGRAIAISAIDNLGKGAAGQAIQNANLMLGFAETTALDGVGLYP